MKKNLYLLTLAAALTASLCACGSSSGSAEAPASAAATATAAGTTAAKQEADEAVKALPTLKDGVLMVGVEIGYPPMEYFDTDGTTPIGYDIEISNALAEYLGLDLELVDTAWDGIFAGVKTDKYDCIISSVSITEERQKEFNLTKPYVSNHTVLIVPKDSGISSLETLKGHSTAVQAETTSDEFMRERSAEMNVELFQYDKILNCFDDLKAGRVDSVMTDSVAASYYLGDDADLYRTVWENEELEPIGICLKKGNDALTEAIEGALDALYKDGTLGGIAVKYFGTDLTEGLRD